MTSKGPGLYEFLIEAELQQYFASFKNDLKVRNVAQLKYVTDDDLRQVGMSKPEMRRLKKYFEKHFPQTYYSKFKKMIWPKKEEAWESTITLPEEGVERPPPPRVPNKHIIPADAILVNKELGTGEFGVVQQGVWTNDGNRIQVAIKCLSRDRMQNNPIEFLKEAAIMHAIDHEHIVRLYGVVLDTNALMLVTELAALRSLLECLKEPSLRSSFPVVSLCHFAIQICDGMQYLEAKRLIHRDLAARNILVFSKNKVKISDFGLSRALGVGKDYYQTNFNVNLKLPIAWCAPECITYLRFTSASDVWAYAVTLWEMFSYGFQPWAALTGHQILEAIDEPNSQRLERPECCPKEYYSLLRKCWHHDPNKRPRFTDIMRQLPDCKPEQVQAIQDSGEERLKRDKLVFKTGEIITVLDKSPLQGGNCWKGVLNNGKTGLFNPAYTVTYLGSNLPSNKPSEFVRGDGKNAYSSKRSRLRPDMISVPQGDVKHTGHVGLDGAYFGDISPFLGGTKQYEHVPHQVVAPYKPQTDEDATSISTDKAPLIANADRHNNGWTDSTMSSKLLTSDHEYHEISDEEALGESPRFEKQFDFGPSLLDEMDAAFRNYGAPPAPPPPPPSPLDEAINKRNEMKEAAAAASSSKTSKKKQATVKPISAADEKTLDTAIALVNEVAAKSMGDCGAIGGSGTCGSGGASPSQPTSPGAGGGSGSASKSKFPFRFPVGGGGVGGSLLRSGGGGAGGGIGANGCGAGGGASSGRPEGRTFADEAASIPDIQGSLSWEAKAVYSSLVEQPAVEATTNPLRMLRTAPPLVVARTAKPRTKSSTTAPPLSSASVLTSTLRTNSASAGCLLTATGRKVSHTDAPSLSETEPDDDMHLNGGGNNAIPLPPRDRSRSLLLVGKPRHERKYPLIIPTHAVAQALAAVGANHTINHEPTYLGLEDEPSSFDNCGGDEMEGTVASSLLDHQGSAPLAGETFPPILGQRYEESFEDRIANDFDLLDQMAEEEDGEGCGSREGGVGGALHHVEGRDDDSDSTAEEDENGYRHLITIMNKVLGDKVTDTECWQALGTCRGDVHRAIKLTRLRRLLAAAAPTDDPHHLQPADSVSDLCALELNDWEVARAAKHRINQMLSSDQR